MPHERRAPKKWEFGTEPDDNGPRCGPAEHAAAARYLTRTGNADVLDVLGLADLDQGVTAHLEVQATRTYPSRGDRPTSGTTRRPAPARPDASCGSARQVLPDASRAAGADGSAAALRDVSRVDRALQARRLAPPGADG